MIDAGIATLLATIIAGAFGWWLNRGADARRAAAEREAQTLKALEFLTGGTQRRSAGLGLLEGLLNETDRGLVRQVFLPVIRNQLIYLAVSTDSRNKTHEHENFVRLINLWKRFKPTSEEMKPLAVALSMRSGDRGLEMLPPYDRDFEELCGSVGIASL